MQRILTFSCGGGGGGFWNYCSNGSPQAQDERSFYMLPATRGVILIAISLPPPPPVSPPVFLGVADWRAFYCLLLVGRKMPTAIYIGTVVCDRNLFYSVVCTVFTRIMKRYCNGRLLVYDASATLRYTPDDGGPGHTCPNS